MRKKPREHRDAVRVGEQAAKHEIARHAREKRTPVILFDLRARRFHQLAVFDARGARGLAGAAIQALIDVLHEGFAERQPALVHQHHLADAPARRIGFEAPEFVRRAIDSDTGRNERSARNRRMRVCPRRKIRSAVLSRELCSTLAVGSVMASYPAGKTSRGSGRLVGRMHSSRAALTRNPRVPAPNASTPVRFISVGHHSSIARAPIFGQCANMESLADRGHGGIAMVHRSPPAAKNAAYMIPEARVSVRNQLHLETPGDLAQRFQQRSHGRQAKPPMRKMAASGAASRTSRGNSRMRRQSGKLVAPRSAAGIPSAFAAAAMWPSSRAWRSTTAGLSSRRDDNGPLQRLDLRGGFSRKDQAASARIGDFHHLRRQDRVRDGTAEIKCGLGAEERTRRTSPAPVASEKCGNSRA